ncbi:MAG TPA: glycosyltransferase [Candidatus Angelobacter sp.]|nr:glycosyltransferase [Candidatus Angelobacter sp.]
MKILIASDLYWPVINGVSTFSRTLAQGLAARGHEVIVIAPSQTGKIYKEVDGNYTIVRTKSVPFLLYQKLRVSITPSREVKKIMNEFNPDVIHIQTLLMIGQAVMKYGCKMGIPIVSTNHAMPQNLIDNLKMLAPMARPISYMLKRYGVRFHAKVDYITMPTQSAIDIFSVNVKKMSVPIEAVSNGIDLSRYTVGPRSLDIMKKFKIPTDCPIIEYVGRVDAEKHLPVLIMAFSRIIAEKEAHLLIVGSGVEIEKLREMAYEMGISKHVTFSGRVSDQDLIDLHKVGTVFCMPSPAELQSIATLEAMASGQPVVAVDAGPLKELCQNKRNGYLCEQDNDKEIAKALLKIISDPDLRESMSKESIAIAATHDLQKTLKRFEKIYTDLIKARTVL